MKLSQYATLALLLSLPLQYAAADTADTRELLHTTGVIMQIEMLQDMVSQSGHENANRCGTTPPVNSLPSFNAESIIHDTIQGIGDIESEDLLTWFQSPLAKKIHKAEQNTIDAAERDQYLPTLMADKSRLNKISTIITNTRTSDFVAIVGSEIEYAGLVLSGCIEKAQSTLKHGKVNREKSFAHETRTGKSLMAILLTADITYDLGFLLRDLSNTELDEYVAFTASDNAQTFYKKLIAALDQSTQLASDRISTNMTIGAIDF